MLTVNNQQTETLTYKLEIVGNLVVARYFISHSSKSMKLQWLSNPLQNHLTMNEAEIDFPVGLFGQMVFQ